MKKVAPGEPVEFKASTWNAFIDAARYVQGAQSNLSADPWQLMNQAGLVIVRNNAGVMMNQFCLVALNTLLINTTNNPNDFFYRTPVFSAGAVTAANLDKVAVAVTQEPIESGKMGKAMIFGVTPAPVAIANSSHRFAIPDPDKPGFFKSADEGDCRILWSPGTTAEQWCLIFMGAGGVTSYRGPFKLTLENNTVKIGNGFDTGSSAGHVLCNGKLYSASAGSVAVTTGYVCLLGKINSSGSFALSYEIKSKPDPTDDTGCYLLGYVKTATGGGTAELVQYHHNLPQLWVFGDCKENT